MRQYAVLIAVVVAFPISMMAASGVYTPNSHTLFYLPLDGPNAGVPEGCAILNPSLLSYIPDRFNNSASAIHVSATASPFDHFYIECSNTKIAANQTQTNDLTVGYWIRLAQAPTAGGSRTLTILSTNGDNGGCRKYVVTEIDNGGLPDGCQGGLDGNIGQFISAASIADGNWHTLVCVFDHTNKVLTLYIDGLTNGSAPLPDPSYTASDFQFIAGAENGSFALDGDMDDFWIEDHAWSAAEVANYYGPSGPPLVSTLGAGGTPENPTASTNEPINTATGDYYTSRSDLVVPGKGLAFNFTRSYNSLDSYSGPLGAGWTHAYNIFLSSNAATANVKEADGHQASFTPLGAGNYAAATAGVFDALHQNSDGTFTLTRKNQTRLNFSAAGKLTSIVDRNGNTETLTYDASGNLVTVLDSSGRTFAFTNDSNGRITILSDPSGRAWQYAYDANGNLVSVRDAADGMTQYTYDANHRMSSAIDARGVTYLRNTFDNLGRVITQTNARGFTTTLAYSTPAPGTTTFTDPLGNATQHVYDNNLRIIEIIDAKGGSVSYTYDASNDRTSVTNQNGRTTSLAYDSNGNGITITDPLGDTTKLTYDTKNNLLTATSPKGNTTTFSYDGNANLTTIRDALGDTTTFAYNGSGLLTSKTDARGDSAAFSYDGFGNLTKITDALGNSTTLGYDGVGRLTSSTDAKGHTSAAAYDPLSRILSVTDPLGDQTEFSYDPVSNLLKITDANGHSTAFAYDSTNDLTTVTDAAGNLTQYRYDGNNNRTGFTNAKGNSTLYAFDAVNRLNPVTDPLAYPTSYAYDGAGNVLSTTDANGKTTEFSYDALNRLLNITYADGSSVSYSYDADGNRTTMVDSHGTTSYTYDALDRLLSVSNPGGKAIHYAYDSVGNRSSLMYSDGKAVGYTYDHLNRLASATDWLGKVTNYSYDAVSNLIQTQYPNRASIGYSYDAANRLTKIVNSAFGLPLLTLGYTLDKVGNRTSLNADGVPTTFGYDPLNELVSAQLGPLKTTWTYDQAGNRLKQVAPTGTTAYTYDADDRLLTAGATTYAFDHNGNLLTASSKSGTVSYTYDPANRLIHAAGPGVNGSYAYDGDGNRVTQTITAGTYLYLNDVNTSLPVVLSEQGPDGAITYAYGSGLIEEYGPSFNYFYHYDGLGSVLALTDAVGFPAAAYAYDPWGNALLTIADTVGTRNKFRFTGEALDPGTNLYYLRARYGDPAEGRFLTRDPFPGSVRLPHSLNKYAYALDNPVRFIDPRGLSAIDMEAEGNAESTVAYAPVSSSSCGTTCVVNNIGTGLGLIGPLSSVARSIGNFYPVYELPFELAQEFASGATRSTALLDVGVQQLINTGIPLLALRYAGGYADVFVTVALYAFNYNLPTAH